MTANPSRRDFLCRGAALVGAVSGMSSAGGALRSSLLAADSAPVGEIRRGGMIYRKLGPSDLYLSLLSFGSHTDPAYKLEEKGGMALTQEGQARRDRQLSRSFDLGVNMVDAYENMGQWEPLQRLIRPKRDKVLVSVCQQLSPVKDNIDRAARLYGHVDLYRICIGDGLDLNERTWEDWDTVRRAKKAGKVRAIGVSGHAENSLLQAVEELEGLDYIMFPYNFIHARADYGEFLPAARKKGVGLIAIKPLAAGSIVKLDPRAPPGSVPENAEIGLYKNKRRPLSDAVISELTKSLNRLPDESLCQAALRFTYSRPFLTCALAGMFQDQEVEDNYAALTRHGRLSRKETAALDAAREFSQHFSGVHGRSWLPPSYRWLDHQWRA